MAKVTVKMIKDSEQLELDVPITANTLAELVREFDEGSVFGHAIIGLKTAFRNKAASEWRKKDATPDSVRAAVQGWKPGVPGIRARKDPMELLRELAGKVSKDQLKAILKNMIDSPAA